MSSQPKLSEWLRRQLLEVTLALGAFGLTLIIASTGWIIYNCSVCATSEDKPIDSRSTKDLDLSAELHG